MGFSGKRPTPTLSNVSAFDIPMEDWHGGWFIRNSSIHWNGRFLAWSFHRWTAASHTSISTMHTSITDHNVIILFVYPKHITIIYIIFSDFQDGVDDITGFWFSVALLHIVLQAFTAPDGHHITSGLATDPLNNMWLVAQGSMQVYCESSNAQLLLVRYT